MKKTAIFMALLTGFAIFFQPAAATTQTQAFQQLQKAKELENKERYDEAIKALATVYKTQPETYLVNLKLGWLSYLKKSYSNSQFHYQKAAAAAPGAIEPLLGESLPLMAQEKWDQVENLMYRVLKIDHFNYYANLRLSIALRLQKKYNLAENIDQKMLSILPASLDFLLEYGANSYYQGKIEIAKSALTYALTLDCNNEAAKNLLYLMKSKK
jgi:tetratricopeptide (TPR) repeat protein